MVTVMFVDVAGSTALGERLDPEAVQRLMARYFSTTRSIIERHGGTVEKFIGDAVMAVFGIPRLHEDDALRAVRAAADLLPAVASLDREIGATHGVTIEVRVGIDSGQVIATDPSSGDPFATGEAVNSAARLEQEAAPSEVLLGDTTYRLVRDAVTVEAIPPLNAKGKSVPIAAHRLVAVRPGAPAHAPSFEAPLVGRERELRRLRHAFDDAVSEQRCELFTLLGGAGVGKSRLVAEFVRSVKDRARILRGHCLPYGDGITYWPLAEAVRSAAGIAETDSAKEARGKLKRLLGNEGDTIAEPLAAAIGLFEVIAGREEIFWAIGRFLEHLAAETPLVVVFEDIHWAEATFLDAIEHVVDRSRGYPILLICPARLELIESRSNWDAGKLNTTTVLLSPLPVDDAERLIRELPGGEGLPLVLRRRIIDGAEGNPLFLEEMVRMLVDDGVLQLAGGRWTLRREVESVAIPPTIHALLGARLDQLLAPERTIATRASVVGRVFEEEAVTQLAPDELRRDVAANLTVLVRKELIQPDRSTPTAGRAFKFRHILVRDAAYESLPKVMRAELHERFADWLERVSGGRISEYEEILGYHLEQAHAYRLALGIVDDHTALVGSRAGQYLVNAGRNAADRRDIPAARSLLSRAISLLPAEHADFWPAYVVLGSVLEQSARPGDAERAVSVLDEAITATRSSNPVLSAEAQLHRLLLEDEHSRSLDEWRRALRPILLTLHRGQNWRASSEAWNFIANVYQTEVDVARSTAAHERAARYAERGRDTKMQLDSLLSKIELAARSRVPVRQVIEMVQEALRSHPATLDQRGWALSQLGYLAALEGRIDEARELIAEGLRIARELGTDTMNEMLRAGVVEYFGGNAAAAERHYRAAYDEARALEPGFALLVAARLAQVTFLLGRDEETERLLQEADHIAGTGANWGAVQVAGTRARLLARQGRVKDAVRFARDGLAAAERSGFQAYPVLYGGCLEDLAAVLADAGMTDEAREVWNAAQHVYQEKGALILVSRAERALASLPA